MNQSDADKSPSTTPPAEPVGSAPKAVAPDSISSHKTASSDQPGKPARPDKPAKPVKPRRWWRSKWIGRTVLAVLVLLLLLRLSAGYIAPVIIDRAAARYDLSASYERLELSILGTNAGLWHLKLSPREGGQPLATIDYVRAHVATWSLLTGRLHLRRAEAEGVTLELQRTADGRLPLLDRVLATLPKTQSKDRSDLLELTPPLRIDALRLSDLHVVFSDEATSPQVQSDMRLNLALTDLDSPVRPTRFMAELHASPLLDHLLIQGKARTAVDMLEADLSLQLRRLDPHAIAGYLRLLGLEPDARHISLKLAGNTQIHIVHPDKDAQASPGQPPATSTVQGQVTLRDIQLQADDQEVAALDELTADISALTDQVANCAMLSVDGARLLARRAEDGRLQLLGVTLGLDEPAVASSRQASADDDDAEADGSSGVENAAPEAPATSSASLKTAAAELAGEAIEVDQTTRFDWRLAELDLRNVSLKFHDRAVQPAADLAVELDHLTLKDETDQPLGPQTVVTLAGQGRLPGLTGPAKLTGQLQPFATPLHLAADLTVEAIRPEAAAPYLAMAGLTSQLENGSLTLSVQADWTPGDQGQVTGDLAVRDLTFEDGKPLLHIDEVAVRGLHVHPLAGQVDVQALQVQGTKLTAARQADGSVLALGFLAGGGDRQGKASRPAASAAAPSGSQSQAVTLADVLAAFDLLRVGPRITLNELDWQGVALTWEDHMVSPAMVSQVTDAGASLRGLVYDPASREMAGEPATYRLWLAAPQWLGSVEMQGRLEAGGAGIALETTLQTQDFNSTVFTPYLTHLGVEPTLQAGQLHVKAALDVTPRDDHWQASARLQELRLLDGERELTAMDLLSIDQLTTTDGTLAVHEVRIVKPTLELARQADGWLVLPGVRVRLTSPTADDQEEDAPADDQAGETDLLAMLDALKLAIGRLTIEQASVGWQDDAVTPTLTTRLTAGLSLEAWRYGDGLASGDLDLRAAVQGIVSEFNVVGKLTHQDASPHLKLDLWAEGLEPAVLTDYLPAGLEVPWRSGTFRAGVEVSAGLHEQGGRRLRLAVSEVDLRHPGQSRPLLKMDQAVIDVARLDLPADVIDLAEISVRGVVTEASRTSEGLWNIAGLTWRPPPVEEAPDAPTTMPDAQASSPTGTPAPAPTPASPSTADAAKPTAAPASTPTPAGEDLARVLAGLRQTAPNISIRKLAIEADSVLIHDATRPSASPIELKQVALTSPNQIDMLGPTPSRHRPIRLKLTMEPWPVARELTVNVMARPFDDEAMLGIDLDIAGILGQGILAALPELADQLAGEALTQGQFSTRLLVRGRVERARPWQLDLMRGGQFDLVLGQTAFRAEPDGQVLAGVDAMRIDGLVAGRDWKTVRINMLDVNQIVGRLWRDEQGTHLLGLTLKPSSDKPAAAWGESAAGQSADQPQPTQASQPAPVASEKQAGGGLLRRPAAPPERVVTIRRLTVNGLDVRYEDKLAKPPLVLPLTGLDVEARNLSTYPWGQRGPMLFNLIATSGQVDVPQRKRGQGLFGALGDTAKLLSGQGGKSQAPVLTQRELFTQVTASGRMRFADTPTGWLKLSVGSLELWPLRGLASQFGVQVDSGAVNLTVDAQWRDNGSLGTQSQVVLRDLSLSEPPNGLISRHLALPAPLDMVIRTIQASDGTITLPLNIELASSQVGTGQVVRAVLGSLTGIITTAVANSPVKLVSGVGSLVGVGGLLPGGDKPPREYEPVMLAFKPGHTLLEGDDARQLDDLIAQLKANDRLEVTLRHELGMADVEIASARANPSRQQVMDMTHQLTAQQVTLTNQRSELAGQARAQLVGGDGAQASATLAELRQLDRDLSRTQRTLDHLYDLLRPGSQRMAPRRTRDAAVAVGQARLASITRRVRELAGEDIAKRVHTMPVQFNPPASPGSSNSQRRGAAGASQPEVQEGDDSLLTVPGRVVVSRVEVAR